MDEQTDLAVASDPTPDLAADPALARLAQVRSRLYGSYATTHVGAEAGSDETTALIYRRDIQPHLPVDRAARIVDLGCGQGHLVRQLHAAGYRSARGIDVSPEQVALAHRSGLTEVQFGDFRELLAGEDGTLDALVAADFLEHLTKDEVLGALDAARRALRPGGLLVARVPNAASPFGAGVCFGDATHETPFTPRSAAQVARAVGFASVDVFACPPPADTPAHRARAVAWFLSAAVLKAVIAAETGQYRGLIVTRNMVVVARPGPARLARARTGPASAGRAPAGRVPAGRAPQPRTTG